MANKQSNFWNPDVKFSVLNFIYVIILLSFILHLEWILKLSKLITDYNLHQKIKP